MACHLDAQIIAASSVKVETSVQTVCLHVKVLILVVCELPTATWSWSILGSSRRYTGQRETRYDSKSLWEIQFYPAGNQLMARSTSSTMKFKQKQGYLHFRECFLRTWAQSTQIGVFPERGGVCSWCGTLQLLSYFQFAELTAVSSRGKSPFIVPLAGRQKDKKGISSYIVFLLTLSAINVAFC